MNVVLIDPSLAGISGDKILSAFTDLSGNFGEVSESLNASLKAIGKRDITVSFECVESHGIRGVRLKINGDGRVEEKLAVALEAAAEAAQLSQWSREHAAAAMDLLSRTERTIHSNDDLHEIGDVDTLIDIVGTFKAIDLAGLSGSEFYTAPLAVGCGWAKSSHGYLPVPAPATLSIIRETGLPMLGLDTPQELTTPTGAAILATLAGGSGRVPAMKIAQRPHWMGIGIGNKELNFPNITRVLLGEGSEGGKMEEIFVVETNVDDVDGELLGWVFERLKEVAEDICIVPMVTKKNRPGHIIRAVATQRVIEKVVETILDETGSLGVKIFSCERRRVERVEGEAEVEIRGKRYRVRFKKNLKTGGVKPSYDDCRKIAIEENMPLRSVLKLVGEKL